MPIHILQEKMKSISAKENVAILVSLIKEWGINNVVVCPGSRNAPIVHTLGNTDGVICHPVTDERSAAFVALGIADATKKVVAVCCTSGSAVLNMSPAIAEAYYRHIPLLIMSADRPSEWIGQMDGQTLMQPNCFGPHAICYDINEVHDDLTRWATERNINEAIMRLLQPNAIPIHINIHLSEPLFVFEEKELPKVKKIEQYINYSDSERLIKNWGEAKNKLIVIGQLRPEDDIKNLLIELSKMNDVAIVAEHLANIDDINNLIWRADDILATKRDTVNLNPDLVVYIGGHIVSKRIKQWLRTIKPNVWHITDENRIIDLFQAVTHIITSDCFWATMSKIVSEKNIDSNNKYCQIWLDKQNSLQPIDIQKWTDVAVVGEVLSAMPENWCLSLGNSSTVRHAQHFKLPQNTIVFCNRGVNGIDGSMSQAVGCALSTKKNVLCILGDLSFFYDMNALWNVALPSNLHILVINNGGGSIFATLPGLEQSEHKWTLVAAQHNTQVKGWAESCNCHYQVATRENMNELFVTADRPIVFEAFANQCGIDFEQQ